MSIKNDATPAPVQQLVGRNDDVGQCWRDFILGDIDSGFEWALHPMLCGRSDYMERFLLSVKIERNRLVKALQKISTPYSNGIVTNEDAMMIALDALDPPNTAIGGNPPIGNSMDNSNPPFISLAMQTVSLLRELQAYRDRDKGKVAEYIRLIKYLMKKCAGVPVSPQRDYADEDMMKRIEELIKKDEAELNPPNTATGGTNKGDDHATQAIP